MGSGTYRLRWGFCFIQTVTSLMLILKTPQVTNSFLSVSSCPRETTIRWKHEFSTSKWTLPLLPSNSGRRKSRLPGRKWHVSENLCGCCRKVALRSNPRTPWCRTSASACRRQRRCWVRSSAYSTFPGCQVPFHPLGSDKGHLVARRVREAFPGSEQCFSKCNCSVCSSEQTHPDDAPDSSPWLLGFHVATTARPLQFSLPAVSQAFFQTQTETPRCLPHWAQIQQPASVIQQPFNGGLMVRSRLPVLPFLQMHPLSLFSSPHISSLYLFPSFFPCWILMEAPTAVWNGKLSADPGLFVGYLHLSPDPWVSSPR